LIQKKQDWLNVLPPIRLLEDNLDPQTAIECRTPV
jgi:hypothetical protein